MEGNVEAAVKDPLYSDSTDEDEERPEDRALALEREEELKEALERCSDGVMFTMGVEKLPFSGKVMSKGTNFQIVKTWFSVEVHFGFGQAPEKLLKNVPRSETRINESELPEGPKKVALELFRVFNLMTLLKKEIVSHKMYFVTLAENAYFGKVISFERKTMKLLTYCDCINHLLYKIQTAAYACEKRRKAGEGMF